MIITFDNKEDYAIWQQTMATNGGKTIVKHEEYFGNGKVWWRQQKMARNDGNTMATTKE